MEIHSFITRLEIKGKLPLSISSCHAYEVSWRVRVEECNPTPSNQDTHSISLQRGFTPIIGSPASSLKNSAFQI